MHDMACHVAEGACAEIPPSAPVPRVVNLVERTLLCRPDKEIPIKGLRYAVCFFRDHESLRPNGTVGKCFHFCHFTDLSVMDPIDHLTNARTRRPLVPHAGSHFVLVCQPREQSRLVHAVRERLLY